jgi:hypothetical protein
MRKIVLTSVAALGFLAIGLTLMGTAASFRPAASFRQADADGSGADVRMNRHNLVAMTDGAGHGRPLLVAMNLFPVADTGNG